MACYDQTEVQSILLKLASEEKSVKFVKYEKLGVISEQQSEYFVNENIYSCISCKKILLSSLLLDIHVSEKHDSFFELQKTKTPCVRRISIFIAKVTLNYLSFDFLQFICYLEDCKFKFGTHQERKDHAIKEHNFPHDFYDFKDIAKNDDILEPSTTSKKAQISHFQFGSKPQKTFKFRPPTKIDVKDLMDALPK